MYSTFFSLGFACFLFLNKFIGLFYCFKFPLFLLSLDFESSLTSLFRFLSFVINFINIIIECLFVLSLLFCFSISSTPYHSILLLLFIAKNPTMMTITQPTLFRNSS